MLLKSSTKNRFGFSKCNILLVCNMCQSFLIFNQVSWRRQTSPWLDYSSWLSDLPVIQGKVNVIQRESNNFQKCLHLKVPLYFDRTRTPQSLWHFWKFYPEFIMNFSETGTHDAIDLCKRNTFFVKRDHCITLLERGSQVFTSTIWARQLYFTYLVITKGFVWSPYWTWSAFAEVNGETPIQLCWIIPRDSWVHWSRSRTVVRTRIQGLYSSELEFYNGSSCAYMMCFLRKLRTGKKSEAPLY